MPLVKCTACSRKLNVPETAVGKQVRCPACKNVFRVPLAEAAHPVVEAVEPAPVRPAAAKPAARPVPPPPPPVDDFEDVAPPPPPPRKPAARAPAPPPPPVDDFEFEDDAPPGPPPRSGAHRPPAPAGEGLDDLDFEEAPPADRKQARRIAKKGVLWLQLGFLFCLLAYVVFATLIFGMEGGRSFARAAESMAVLAGLSAIYLIPVIFMAVGASLLASLRARGMVITACIFAFIAALQALAYGGFWAITMLAAMSGGVGVSSLILFPVLIVLFSFLGVVFSIIGGIRGLILLGRPEVKAAYAR
ncbi:MAG: hypothetical protein IT429_13895 [Gemmataceae bacterium]|nr:hypothetical protein [Gemmataceae bacterium]